jgi:hypothetical protein
VRLPRNKGVKEVHDDDIANKGVNASESVENKLLAKSDCLTMILSRFVLIDTSRTFKLAKADHERLTLSYIW